MDDCYTVHPYQWVDLVAPTDTFEYEKLEAEWEGPRHDVNLPARHTGRLILSIELLTPLLIGDRQDDGLRPATVSQFTDLCSARNEAERWPAIPGSSLRGRLSAVAEALSGSAMRVLADTPLSRRMAIGEGKPDEPFDALGRVELGPDERWRIVPVEYDKLAAGSDTDADTLTIWDHRRARWLDPLRHKQGAVRIGADKSTPAIDALAPNGGCAVAVLAEMLWLRTRNRTAKEIGEHAPPFVPVEHCENFPWEEAQAKGAGAWGAYLRAFEQWIAGKHVFYQVVSGADAQASLWLSFSQVWRKPFDVPSVHSSFRGHLPWGAPQRQDTKLSPAEALFGVIEERPSHGEAQAAKPARLLAGRLQVSDCRAVGGRPSLGEPVTLKELSSPKPPSPRMYFKREPSRAPNGRKFYPPQAAPEYALSPGGQDARCLRGRPLLPADDDSEPVRFVGHIDVNNLSAGELDLLLHAVSPAPDVVHALGLGRPLGLGAVRIEVLGFWPRLCGGMLSKAQLDAPKWGAVRGAVPDERLKSLLAQRYPEELAAAMLARDESPLTPDALLAGGETSLVHDKALERIVGLGRMPDGLTYPITYPRHADQSGRPVVDSEGYEWFVRNEKLGPKGEAHSLSGAGEVQGRAFLPVLP